MTQEPPTTSAGLNAERFTLGRSEVYHKSKACTALNRRNRYWRTWVLDPIRLITLREAFEKQLRPCRLCND